MNINKITFLVSILLSLLLAPMVSQSAGSSVALESHRLNLGEKSLQRGLKYFTNYCMGCHSASYSRYNRVAADLNLSEQQMLDNIIFTRGADGEKSKVGEKMMIAMTEEYGKETFGVAPPDLSLTARSRGADWIYTYLKSFYLDESRPMGVNNTVFENVGMPHVLWPLQGWQKKAEHHDDDGHGGGSGFEQVTEGDMTADEYDQVVTDITNFMVYLSEPAQAKRKSLGIKVMMFLFLFTGLAYLLKKEYWRDVH